MRKRQLIVSTVVLFVLIGALSFRERYSAPATPSQPKLAPARKAAPLNLKPPPAGLYWVDGPEEYWSFIDHAVIGDDWASLEPKRDDFSGPGWKAIDEALEAFPEYSYRLRIFMGRDAPGWVKDIGGGCIDVNQPASGISACVPRFWTEEYLDEYEELMAEIARRYDDEPQILDIVNSACTTIWAEPFIRAGDDEESNRRLWESGLNEESDSYCLTRSTEDMAALFEETRISLATHLTWQIVVSDGIEPSWGKQRLLLDALRAYLGEQLIIQNNGLGGDEGCEEGAEDMWCWLSSIAPPKGMQTEGDAKLALDGYTVEDAIVRASELGGCFVEHNQFGTDPSIARRLDSMLKANC